MPRFQSVPIGLLPETIDELDRLAASDETMYDSRADVVRSYVREGLEGETDSTPDS